jgi:hypothetical protein
MGSNFETDLSQILSGTPTVKLLLTALPMLDGGRFHVSSVDSVLGHRVLDRSTGASLMAGELGELICISKSREKSWADRVMEDLDEIYPDNTFVRSSITIPSYLIELFGDRRKIRGMGHSRAHAVLHALALVIYESYDQIAAAA